MSLQIRRGTDAQRQTVVFDLGEIVYATDTQKLYVGDGTTAGGINILATTAGNGLTWNSTTQTLNFGGSLTGLTTDNLSQGTVNLYYSSTKARADAAAMFTTTGSPTVTGSVTATTAPHTVTVSSNSGLVAYEPFIITGTGGGGLSAGTYYIINPAAGTNQITLANTLAGAQAGTALTVTSASLTGTTFSAGGPDSNISFVYNPTTGTMSVNAAGAGITSVSQDTSPQLGGNLNLNTYTINGHGNINNTGNITASGAVTGNTLIGTTGLGANLPLNSYSITGNGSVNITGQILATPISTTLTAITSNTLTLTSTTNMIVGMPIVFGLTSQTASTIGNIVPYNTYYILSINGTQITISQSIGGGLFAAGSGTGTMLVTANGLDTGVVTTQALNVESMLTFRDMTYPVNTNTYQITGVGGYFVFGEASAPSNFVFNANSADQPFTVRGVTSGFLGNQPQMTLGASRGTLAAQTLVQNGDSIGLIRFDPYTGTSQMAGYANGGFITAYVTDNSFTTGSATVNTTIAIGNIADAGSGVYTTFAPGGVVTVPTLVKKLVVETANYISVSSTSTYSLSTTYSRNLLIVSNTGYTATLTFPSTGLIDGQILNFTVTTNTVTLALTAGPTLVGTFAGSVAANTTFNYIYRASNTTWYRY
jgi:Major tropism determinant N-terminal domain